jgi:hypothetical protein
MIHIIAIRLVRVTMPFLFLERGILFPIFSLSSFSLFLISVLTAHFLAGAFRAHHGIKLLATDSGLFSAFLLSE